MVTGRLFSAAASIIDSQRVAVAAAARARPSRLWSPLPQGIQRIWTCGQFTATHVIVFSEETE